jgi:hypothetical protein
VTETGKVISMSRAYKKLSDAALATSSGSLSSLSKSDAGESEEGNVRLAKDHIEGAENSEYVDSSEEDLDDTSSEDEALSSKSSPEKPRGRQQESVSSSRYGDWSGKKGPGPPLSPSPSRAGALSLLAELEEERRCSFSLSLAQ